MLSSIAVSVQAQSEFSEVDTDGDGFITVEESAVMPELETAFGDFDQDNDGKLDEDEYTQYIELANPPDTGG
jgi:Ca2+-binding EF-hand superfamily protein